MQEWHGDAEEVERRIRRNGLDPGLRLRRLALQLISVKTIDPAFTGVGESDKSVLCDLRFAETTASDHRSLIHGVLLTPVRKKIDF